MEIEEKNLEEHTSNINTGVGGDNEITKDKLLLNDFLPKKVMAIEKYGETKETLIFLGISMALFFLCGASSGKNWFTIIFCGFGIGWNVVKLVKTLQTRKYLESKYNLK